MCGVAGVVRSALPKLNEESAREGVAVIRHRGPDAMGTWANEHVGIGHARLSVIDLSAAANQPMHSGSAPVVVAFNGEIYNYKDLRDRLRSRGHHFRTESDTEVVLQAYVEWGVKSFEMLSGMFAVAIWDGRSQTFLLARDRFGIKPIFYCVRGGALYFGSELKSILAMCPGLVRRIDRQAMREFLWFGNALGSRSMFDGLRRLEAGCYLVSGRGEHRISRYWTLADVPEIPDSYPVAVERVRELLRASVQSHMVADVPVGVFLSGGVDSSAITALAAGESVRSLATYSVGFDGDGGGELQYARLVAQRFGTAHEEIVISATQAKDAFETLIGCHDEPFSDAANIPLYLLAKHLRGRVKVVLQGDGGDEVFAGYGRYEWLGLRHVPWRSVALVYKTLRSVLPRRVARQVRIVDALAENNEVRRCALLLTVETARAEPEVVVTRDFRNELYDHDPFARYAEVLGEMRDTDPVQRMLRVDTRILLPDTFLEKVDRSTMANGLEVRVPFLGSEVAEYAMGLPSSYKVKLGTTKRVLKAALRGVVPDEIIDRKKAGFGVPYQSWLKGPLYEFLNSSVSCSQAVKDGVIDGSAVRVLAKQHRDGVADRGFLLWKVLNFVCWYDRYRVGL